MVRDDGSGGRRDKADLVDCIRISGSQQWLSDSGNGRWIRREKNWWQRTASAGARSFDKDGTGVREGLDGLYDGKLCGEQLPDSGSRKVCTAWEGLVAAHAGCRSEANGGDGTEMRK